MSEVTKQEVSSKPQVSKSKKGNRMSEVTKQEVSSKPQDCNCKDTDIVDIFTIIGVVIIASLVILKAP